jgi:hypothetical protein
VSYPAATNSGIMVRTRIFPLHWMQLFFKVNIWLDGNLSTVRWGAHYFDAAPGSHEVIVSFQYFYSTSLGKNTISVDVVAGQTTFISYRPSWISFLKGPIYMDGTAPTD